MSNPVALARQDALTSRYLGIDFVPLSAHAEPVVAGHADAPSPDPLAEVKPPAPAAPPSHVRVEITDAERARRAAALEAVRQRYLKDEPHKHFVTAHTNIVFGEGDPAARLMFIGEAPGADEDRTGRPFVGRAGQLLEKMIGAMGLKREQVYICNVLKTRPPDNATPTIEEAAKCAPYLFDQIAAVRPEAIVTLGLPASRLVLSSMQSMGSMRGRWQQFRHPNAVANSGLEVPVMPTYHPAYVLRQYTPQVRAQVWADLKQVMDRLGLRAGSASAT